MSRKFVDEVIEQIEKKALHGVAYFPGKTGEGEWVECKVLPRVLFDLLKMGYQQYKIDEIDWMDEDILDLKDGESYVPEDYYGVNVSISQPLDHRPEKGETPWRMLRVF